MITTYFPSRLHARSAGYGPTVICLHSSGASAQQWQPLASALGPRRQVVCVDAHGHGRSPAPEAGMQVFAQDAAWLAPFVAGAYDSDSVHLVGHSYGGALAIQLALAHPHRVRSLTLYEPVLFSLLDDPSVAPAAREEIRQVGRTIAMWVQLRQPLRAARVFVEYWSGPGAWRALGARQQKTIAARMPVIAAHFESLFDCGITLAQVTRLRVPTLLLSGGKSPRAARALVNALTAVWPHADPLHYPDLGHLGPITHPDRVNRMIVGFIGAVELRTAVRAGDVEPVRAAA